MATNEQIKNYVETVYPVAKKVCSDRGYASHLAEVCLIQGALESGYGTASVMVKHNALFGVKATNEDVRNNEYYTAQTYEYDNTLKKYVSVMAMFRAFNTLEDNIKHYFGLISNKRYGACLYSKDVREALQIIWSCGYATSPDYVSKCLNVQKILNKFINTEYNYIVNTERDNLNVREKPNGNILTSLPKGTKIYADDKWLYVPLYNGFVHKDYVKGVNANE